MPLAGPYSALRFPYSSTRARREKVVASGDRFNCGPVFPSCPADSDGARGWTFNSCLGINCSFLTSVQLTCYESGSTTWCALFLRMVQTGLFCDDSLHCSQERFSSYGAFPCGEIRPCSDLAPFFRHCDRGKILTVQVLL